MICLYLGYTDSFTYQIRLVTSNRTFEDIRGKISILLEGFSLNKSIDEPWIYSDSV